MVHCMNHVASPYPIKLNDFNHRPPHKTRTLCPSADYEPLDYFASSCSFQFAIMDKVRLIAEVEKYSELYDPRQCL